MNYIPHNCPLCDFLLIFGGVVNSSIGDGGARISDTGVAL